VLILYWFAGIFPLIIFQRWSQVGFETEGEAKSQPKAAKKAKKSTKAA
jgi:hypothetical protein